MSSTRVVPATLLVLCASASTLAGCATAPDQAMRYVPPRSVASISQDRDFMQRVDAAARQRGIDVVWINPPVKRAPAR